MTVLLAYPRSGSTWLRYCIEFLSKRPTGVPKSGNLGDNSICEKIPNMGVDTSKPSIIYKTHNIPGFNENYDKMIVIVRDYKEVISRHNKAKPKELTLRKRFPRDTRGMENEDTDYIKIIEQYDVLKEDKILIYYEDLMLHPRKVLAEVLDLLDVDYRYLDEFIKNYRSHQFNGVKSYHDKSYTFGAVKKLKYHQSKISPHILNDMTSLLKKRHAGIFDKYLKRYG